MCGFVCVFVCQHDNFRTSKHRMMKLGVGALYKNLGRVPILGGRNPMQFCVDSSHMSHWNLSDHSITFTRWRHIPSWLAQSLQPAALQRVACSYDVGKISAGRLVSFIHFASCIACCVPDKFTCYY